MRRLLIYIIQLYQGTRVLRRPCCRFYPSCSSYMAGCIEKHGMFKGFVLGAVRLLRCSPLSAGGIDDVPEQCSFLNGLWRRRRSA